MSQHSAQVKSVLGHAPLTVVAGGAADNVAQNGPAVDRSDYFGAVVAIPIRTVLAANQNVIVSCKLQTRTDGGAYSDLTTATSVTLSSVPGGTVDGLLEHDAELEGAGDEIRAVITANLLAAVTDTCAFSCVIVLGDPVHGPV